MKKKLLIVLVLLTLIFTSCIKKTPIKQVAKTLEIPLKDYKILEEVNSHQGFHGDGETFYKIKLKDTDELISMINGSKFWHKLDDIDYLDENMINGLILFNMKGENLTSKFIKDLTSVNDGYLFFKNRFQADKNNNADDSKINFNSFNFTMGVLDINNNILYYYENDI